MWFVTMPGICEIRRCTLSWVLDSNQLLVYILEHIYKYKYKICLYVYMCMDIDILIYIYIYVIRM